MSEFNKDYFKHDMSAALRKFRSDLHISVGVPVMPFVHIGIDIPIGKKYNPTTDAYLCCKHCGMHYNYHVNGKCPEINRRLSKK